MKKFLTSVAGKICLAALPVILLAGAFGIWWLCQPKFQDVTIELGSSLPSVEMFLTEYANPAKVKMVTPEEDVDLSKAGQQDIVLAHGHKEHNVILTIQDTVAPEVIFQDVVTPIDKLPEPEDFVAKVTDEAVTTAAFVEAPEKPEGYHPKQVEVTVTDASGNSVVGQCTLHYTWLHDKVNLELGQPLEKSDVLLDPERDYDLLEQKVVDMINGFSVGTYKISSTFVGEVSICTITVQDSTPPVLELQPVQIDLGESVSVDHFIKTAEDPSGEVEIRLMTTLNTKEVGTQTVVIEAEDIYGNVASAETTLQVRIDSKPPVFSGVKEIVVEKNGSVNYFTGVSAKDARDGVVSFKVDSGSVNLSKAGTYYATYTATDSEGNVATVRRRITVKHSKEDTQALVESIAATLSSDPEQIRDYVRNTIQYSSEWGGEDPVWYGFTTKNGNCYVHALCLQRLLTLKGYETRLIWVTNKTHYWLIINLNGVWRHIDATPGNVHTKYSLMTDDMRYSTLKGRDWDRSLWPACE